MDTMSKHMEDNRGAYSLGLWGLGALVFILCALAVTIFVLHFDRKDDVDERLDAIEKRLDEHDHASEPAL